MTTDLLGAVERGSAFLAARQLPSGQFPIESTLHPEGTTEPDHSLFATTHIVYSLGDVPGPVSATMIARALAYFAAEGTPHGLWRYWNRDAVWGGRRVAPLIPADLDDTSSVSYLLRRHNVPFPDNRGILERNRSEGGLFYTWLMPRAVPTLNPRYWWATLREVNVLRLTAFWKTTEAGYRDIDGVVNANVLLYLGECAATEAVIPWLVDIVRAGREAECDKWYRDPFSFHYALSRTVRAGVSALEAVGPDIVTKLHAAAARSGQIGEHALHTALAVNTMLNFEVRDSLIDRAVSFLLETQATDGSWPTAAHYYGGPKRAVSWGSAELTTGFCLEALSRCAARRAAGHPRR